MRYTKEIAINAMNFFMHVVQFTNALLNLPQLTLRENSLMAWLITFTVFICLGGIIYLIFWIRRVEKKVDNFTKYLMQLDDKNYRLWKAKLKAEQRT